MVASKMNKDAQMREAINQKLIETGERECLKEWLRAKLTECGWKDQLKAHLVGNPPANAGDTGSIPGQGRSCMPRSS
uniref:Transcription and mRNA export factor ENY2 n=1 Tax=Phocoena sinus TaxID=42100 RepID=A0A8C9BZM7_PHOSS